MNPNKFSLKYFVRDFIRRKVSPNTDIKKGFGFSLLLTLFLLGCSPSIKNLNSTGENVVCFGDSITYGVGAEEGKNYPFYLAQMIERNVINAGVSGDTTMSALRRIKRDVLDKNPYLVIVELGGNDFLRKMPLKETLRNLEEIITHIQGKGAIVVLCDVSTGFIMRGYSVHLGKIARKHGAVFIPHLLEGIINNLKLKSDYIHPNSKGYKIIAQRIYAAIKPYL